MAVAPLRMQDTVSVTPEEPAIGLSPAPSDAREALVRLRHQS